MKKRKDTCIRATGHDNSRDSPDDRIREMSWGYRPAILLLTANRLKVFDALSIRPSAASDVARRLGLDERAITVVLDALVAMGLLEKREKVYRCRADVKNVLVPGGKRFQGNILEHRFNVLQRWMDLPRVVRKGGPAKVMRSKRTSDEWRDFILGMDDIASQSAEPFLDALDISGRKRLLDLGGGPGTYAIALCMRYPGLQAVIFDLPETASIARTLIKRHGLAKRITTMAGDYLRDPLGNGYDVVLISNIVHSLSLDEFSLLMRKACAAMTPGGMVAVRDFYLDESRTRPLESALFAVNMLVSTAGGNCYTPSEMKAVLRSAGFGRLRMKKISPVSSLYLGTR
jgi:DNA-binding MarR family transcriptional regulator